MKLLVSGMFVVALLAATGCQSYGARKHHVAIESLPSGADVYLVPYTQWELSDGPERLHAYATERSDAAFTDLRDAIAPHRVATGRTPIEITLTAREQMLFVEKDGVIVWKRFLPRPHGKSDQHIEVFGAVE